MSVGGSRPTTEVDLCGHATLATAHVIKTADRYPGRTGFVAHDERLRFATNSGELTAAIEGEEVVLDFPATPVRKCVIPAEISLALGGADVVATGESGSIWCSNYRMSRPWSPPTMRGFRRCPIEG
ncbi:MAG: PhzF family phenazine biosynthesis protein [Pseudonocardia sp.]|nr:PhzF family phenazine biosynthesis protein [Pseudonocardia sp.]